MNRSSELYAVGLLAVWLLAGCAGYAAVVLCTATAPEALAIAASLPGHGPLGSHWATQWQQLRLALAGAAGGLALLGGLAGWARPASPRGQGAWLPTWRALAQSWRALAPRQRHGALAALAALTSLRYFVSRGLVTFDDSASYEYFVRKSLLAVSAYYPAPNNHILSNTLSWLFYQLYPGYWWSMRLPALLVSTAATAGWFLGLLRATNFRVAALAIGLFSLLEASLFYAVEGRGYPLLLALSGVGFFGLLALTDPAAEAPARPPLGAWAGLAGAGVLGLYTIPTFAYFLVAAYSWLALSWLRRGSRHRLASLALLGAATLLGAALLYAPLLWVSGPAALFHNQYVQPLTPAAFWQQLPAYVWGVEGELLGESYKGFSASLHVGSLAAVVVMLVFLGLWWAARRGQLRAPTAAYLLRLGGPALWFIVVPYSLMLAQHVLAPGRSLLFKAVFMFLLIGLETDWLLRRVGPRRRQLGAGLLLAAGLWAGVQLAQLYRSNRVRLTYFTTPRVAAQWLLAQPPGPVLSHCSGQALSAIRFFIHAENPTSSLAIDEAARPGVRYRYRLDSVAAPLASPGAVALPHLHRDRDVHSAPLDITAQW